MTIRKGLLYIYIFSLLYMPPILGINILYLIGFIAWTYIGMNNFRQITYLRYKNIGYIYIIFVILFMYAIFISILNGKICKDILVPIIFFAFFIIPGCIYISEMCLRYRISWLKFLDCMLLIGNIQGILSLLFYIYPTLRTIYIDALIGRDLLWKYSETYLYSYRYFGLSQSVITYMPLVQVILALLAMYLGLSQSKRYFLYSPLLLFSSFINARSPILIFGVGCILLFLFKSKDSYKQDRLRKIILFFVCILLISILLIELKSTDSMYINWMQEGLNSIGNLIMGRKVGIFDKYLLNPVQWKLPTDIVSLIFGVGHYVVSEDYKGYLTDVGYVNYIWNGGIVFLIILAIFCYIIFGRYATKLKKDVWRFSKYIFILTFLLFSFKMPIFACNELIVLFFIFYIFENIICINR